MEQDIDEVMRARTQAKQLILDHPGRPRHRHPLVHWSSKGPNEPSQRQSPLQASVLGNKELVIVAGEFEVADWPVNSSSNQRQTRTNEQASLPMRGLSHVESGALR